MYQIVDAARVRPGPPFLRCGGSERNTRFSHMGPGQILSPGGKKEGFGLDSYWGGHIFPPAGWWAGTPLEGKLRFVVAPYGGKQFSPESPLVPTIFGPDPCVVNTMNAVSTRMDASPDMPGVHGFFFLFFESIDSMGIKGIGR